MVIKTKIKGRNVLSPGQERLLRESLKQLFGQGLIYTRPQRSQREEKANFLRDALNSKALDAEWLA